MDRSRDQQDSLYLEPNQDPGKDSKKEDTLWVDLGLDISTTTVGITVLNQGSHRVVMAGWLDLSKVTGFWSKVDLVSQVLVPKLEETLYNTLDRVFVEEPALRYAPGRSSAGTLALLQRFNGIVCSKVRESRLEPSGVLHVNANTARKGAGLKILRKHPQNLTSKDQVVAQVRTHPLGKDLPWRFHIAPTGRWKGQSVVDHQCEDMADSWVVCYGGQVTGGRSW